ncbi:MAG: zinc transporter ZntB [Desulfobacterales bacterium]
MDNSDANDGLIFAYILDGKGGGQALDWAGLEKWTPDQGLLWIHLDYTKPKVQKWLTTESGLSELSIDILKEQDTRPRMLNAAEGLFLILRGVNCNPGSDPEDMVSLRMHFTASRIITMRQRKIMAVDDTRNAIDAGQGPAHPADFLVMVAERIADRMWDVISDIDDQVDVLEDSVLTVKSAELRPQLAQSRRQCTSLRRYIAPQRDVLTKLLNEKITLLDDPARLQIREIAERTARFVEDIDSARERAAITLEELDHHLSEQTNRAMYLLAIVTAIFLPLSLLTGLLGINVGGMPGADNPMAFSIVTIILLLIAAGLVWLFRHIRWI